MLLTNKYQVIFKKRYHIHLALVESTALRTDRSRSRSYSRCRSCSGCKGVIIKQQACISCNHWLAYVRIVVVVYGERRFLPECGSELVQRTITFAPKWKLRFSFAFVSCRLNIGNWCSLNSVNTSNH
jgi:hypothetical protein